MDSTERDVVVVIGLMLKENINLKYSNVLLKVETYDVP